jgi:hypothetical protein
LLVAVVVLVVLSPVAEVDPTKEGDVPFGATWVTKQEKLLMVRATRAYWHVEQAFSAGRLDLLAEVTVLGLVVAQPIQVRSPDQAPDHDAAGGRIGEHSRHLGAWTVQSLIWSPRQSVKKR